MQFVVVQSIYKGEDGHEEEIQVTVEAAGFNVQDGNVLFVDLTDRELHFFMRPKRVTCLENYSDD